jgi:glycosyltransferase involved in cell wall biosynthesis
MARPRVVYWLKQPTPYFVERCNAISDRGTLEFEAWFNTRVEPDRSWDVDESAWRFPARYMPTRSILHWRNRLPIPELASLRPDLIVQEYDRMYLSAGFLAARALAGRTAFRVLPNFDSWSDRTWWRELSKHFVFRAVDGAKVPGPDGAALARRYGLPTQRTAEVTQAVDVEHFSRALAVPEPARRARRDELGLRGVVFVYVGRLWSGKGVDDLLSAYAGLEASGADVSLLLVGDGVDEQRLRERARPLRRVIFAGFQQRDSLPGWYAAADVMVFPTLGDPNGLVLEEALAAGLPVISADAAGDIHRRLPPEGPGLVVPAGDAAALGAAMGRLVEDPELRATLAARARPWVEPVTPARFAADFEAFAAHVLALPRRNTPAAQIARVAGRLLVRAAGSAPVAPYAHGRRLDAASVEPPPAI